MTKKISVFFLFLFCVISVVQASNDEYVVQLYLTIAGPEIAYFVIENGPNISTTVGFRHEKAVLYEVFNDFDEGWDGIVFIPDNGEIFYPVVALKPWQNGQLQGWIFKESSETEQGLTIFHSGLVRPNRPQPPLDIFASVMAMEVNKPKGTASVQAQGKFATTWGRMKQ